jgi:tetratricopeptide (TPR) repeat protein
MEVNQALLEHWFDKMVKQAKERYQILIASGLGVILLAVGVWGYIYYKNSIRAHAYKDFIVAMQYYNGAVKSKKDRRNPQDIKIFQSEADKWQQTEQVFRQGYEKYKNTEMAPVFLSFLSESLLNLGKVDQSIEALRSFIGQVKSKEIKDCYILKIALIKMDSRDARIKEEGLKSLITVADDDSNFSNEIALYHAGAYFWSQKKYSEAKNYWQRFLVKSTAKTGQTSIYAAQVREKLNLISPESL